MLSLDWDITEFPLRCSARPLDEERWGETVEDRVMSVFSEREIHDPGNAAGENVVQRVCFHGSP